jgi:23S rRNA (cytosine1962-C5)-methyltransferase
LLRLEKSSERFDLVVVDPPTYAKARGGSRFTSSQRDWVALARAVFAVVSPLGVVLACSNDERTSDGALRRYLRSGLELAGRKAAQMKSFAPPADFPERPWALAHLKSVLLRLED